VVRRSRPAAREALRALAELPERQAHLLARQAAGLSYDEIAAETGDSRRTVDRQLGRARAQIREAGGET
jgi:RNA polymerase sigma factor (sigma-70 family)